MPGEIISLLVGQCGNQIGQQYWSRLCAEHGISASDGSRNADSLNLYEQPDIYFNLSSNNRYTPRAILVDLEPGVIGKLPENGLFNPRNTYLSKEGSSSGNNWAYGYQYAHDYSQEIMDIIDHELDSCDNLEAFQLLHSVGGGTGSGAGSYLLEQLNDRYGKKLLTTFSVFEGANSSVVVHPYNTVLALRRLIEHSDACVVFDNSSLHNIASECFVDTVSFFQINELIATAMATFSNTMRFPNYLYTSLSHILSTLVPTPDFKFLSTSFSPFTSDTVAGAKDVRSSTAYDVILKLLDQKLQMINQGTKSPSFRDDLNNRYLAVLDILVTNDPRDDLTTRVDQDDIQKALMRAHQRARFVPWCPSSIHLAHGTKSPYLQPNKNIVSGLMIANTTNVALLFQKTCSQFDSMFARKMFMNNYTRHDLFSLEDGILAEFQESREVVRSLIEEYGSCLKESYLDDEDEVM
ncbi:hypothetical protein BABINDRAFT_159812 [Babjeviella inositovora NRRL Y-12698]|uniref:Tubulin gamma chain n=1 Tax=Babjeviella inositovora NRRL Y-12698 TaxID=984486 RepID=A0A1E3QV53_9ASCO|nr:uncharacterized protein BABINDRAFT_159812 [Babjeviella inositovora NRRL Y-12698]ODQ81535.1 hypothetical protein BABINDRAFT_159812 [Babjeviella inositovora NRRL Y-12698]